MSDSLSLDRLKLAVQQKFGRPIRKRGECEALAELIFEETGIAVSYNTLRRIYKLVQYDGGFNRSTLDALAKYVGYRSFYEVEIGASPVFPVEQSNAFFLTAQGEGLSFENFKQFLREINASFHVQIFKDALFVALRQQQDDFLKRIFELDEIFKDKSHLDASLYFLMQWFGMELRTEPIERVQALWQHWAPQRAAREHYFELFVDVDCLLSRHYLAIEAYQSHATLKQERLFAHSLLCWRKLFTGVKNSSPNDLDVIEGSLQNLKRTELHGIPLARAYACLLLQAHSSKAPLQPVLDQISKVDESLRKEARRKNTLPYFHYWITGPLLLVGANRVALDFCEHVRNDFTKEETYFTKGANARMQLYEAIALKRLNLGSGDVESFNSGDFFAFSRSLDSLYGYYALSLHRNLTGDEEQTVATLLDATGYHRLWELLKGFDNRRVKAG